MANRAAADVGLGDLVHLDGAHDSHMDARLLNRILQRNRVDHGRQHTHVVGCDAIHVDGLLGHPAKEVTAADDDADLAAGAGCFGDFMGNCVDEQGVDTETTACGQGFSG